MKFCYLDESGTGNEPYAVMVGIIVDSYRMHLTKRQWTAALNALSEMLGQQLLEIHTRDFYAGNGIWRHINGEDRAKIISIIFKWLKERKHNIVYTAVDKAKFTREHDNEKSFASEIDSLWCFMALHICLSIQKYCQGFERNKGNTVLIFDNEEIEGSNFVKLMRNPPEWTDTYYNRHRQQNRLDQIIDVPYFGDSRHVGLIQVADFVSFFLRKYIQIHMGSPPDYEDEPGHIEGWVKTALKQSIPSSTIFLSKGRCPCAELFYRCAPTCLLS